MTSPLPSASLTPPPGPRDPHSSVLVVGAGWLGSALADRLAASGHPVWLLRRTPARTDTASFPLVRRVAADVVTAATDQVALAALPASVDALVLCTAPSRARGESHADSYPAAARGAVALARRLGAGTLLYTSSTGVYAATDGRVVDEAAPLPQGDPRVDALVEAEAVIRGGASAVPGLRTGVLRVAGLYGPGRDPAPRFRDPALREGLAGGDWWTNFAWRDDVVGALVHLLDEPGWLAPGPEGGAVFNCADGHPVRASAIVAALTGQPVPGARGADGPGARPSGRSNQRVDASALRRTGWRPTMPTVFDGLRALGHDVAPSAPT